jgi:hypothetical protein
MLWLALAYAEIMAIAAERAEVTAEEVIRELKALSFSDIGKVVRWRPELALEETGDEDSRRQVLVSRVLVVDSETLSPNVRIGMGEGDRPATSEPIAHGALADAEVGCHLGLGLGPRCNSQSIRTCCGMAAAMP